MKKILILAAAILTYPILAESAQTAQARLYSQSVKFQRGTEPNHLYSIDLTTLSQGINGELSPLPPGSSYTHWSWFNHNDHIFDETRYGTLNLDLPALTDANGNGWDDFFEVSQSHSATTEGAYSFDDEGVPRSLLANWSRSAGSASGTCVLTFAGYGTYTHTFRILEYTGALVYTSAATSVAGFLQLEQTGDSSTTLEGNLAFTKNPGNPYNQLTLTGGWLTNAASQTLTFFNDAYARDAAWPTNYYGYLEFQDFDPNTGEDDYWLWVLSIDDTNDADADGIPDFSDDPVIAPPTAPTLSLQSTSTHLLLTINGDVGRSHQVQEIDSLASTGWQDTVSVTLTNNPHTIALPFPENSPRFFRVLAK